METPGQFSAEINTSMFNRYAYAANDPINMWDPFGKDYRCRPGGVSDDRIGTPQMDCSTVWDKEKEGDGEKEPSKQGRPHFLKDKTKLKEGASRGEANIRKDGIYGSDSTKVADARDRASALYAEYEATRNLDEMGPNTFNHLETGAALSASPALILVGVEVVGAAQAAAIANDLNLLGKYGLLFGRGGRSGGGIFNSNSILRIGYGWKGSGKAGTDVFRIAIGEGKNTIHINVYTFKKPPS